MSNVIVSVIIPCFNSSEYIGRCLDHLENQSYKKFEVCIVDDCSNDGTFDLVESIRDNYSFPIILLKNQVNSGPSHSRQNGIGASSGRYVCFCDSDDWYEERFLEVMVNAVEENDSDIAFCGHYVIDQNGKRESRELVFAKQRCKFKDAVTVNCDSMCTMIVKNDIAKKVPFPPTRNGEDMAVIPILMGKAENIYFIRECLYNYYRRTGSASQTPRLEVVDSLIESFYFLFDHFDKSFFSELEFLGVRNMLYTSEITLFSITIDRKRGRDILKQFERFFPNWSRNPLIKTLPLYKRIVLALAHYRLFVLLRFVALYRLKRTERRRQ